MIKKQLGSNKNTVCQLCPITFTRRVSRYVSRVPNVPNPQQWKSGSFYYCTGSTRSLPK